MEHVEVGRVRALVGWIFNRALAGLAVDLKGTALCLKYELKQMRAQGGGGSIINISSVSGFRPSWARWPTSQPSTA